MFSVHRCTLPLCPVRAGTDYCPHCNAELDNDVKKWMEFFILHKRGKKHDLFDFGDIKDMFSVKAHKHFWAYGYNGNIKRSKPLTFK